VTRFVLLPGLDGTGLLFRPLLAYLDAEVVSYPCDVALGYDELMELIAPRLVADCTLVAESFSGPLAVRLAERGLARALVLVNSFLTNPAPWLPSWLVRWRPPDWAMSPVLLGLGAPAELGSALRHAVGLVSTPVLVARIREVLQVDVRPEFSRLSLPIRCLAARQDWLVRPRYPPAVPITWMHGPHLLLQRHPEECAHWIKAAL
jgi:hypothetical protein